MERVLALLLVAPGSTADNRRHSPKKSLWTSCIVFTAPLLPGATSLVSLISANFFFCWQKRLKCPFSLHRWHTMSFAGHSSLGCLALPQKPQDPAPDFLCAPGFCCDP